MMQRVKLKSKKSQIKKVVAILIILAFLVVVLLIFGGKLFPSIQAMFLRITNSLRFGLG